MKKFILSVSLFMVFLVPINVQAQQDSTLRKQIEEIAKPVKGIAGVSILGIENRDTLTLNGNARLVMQSVMKLPIALTVLHLIDTGKLSLDQIVHITRRDLPKDTYSPLRDKYPKGDIDMSVSDLLGYMVSLSDNNACDILLKLIDGYDPTHCAGLACFPGLAFVELLSVPRKLIWHRFGNCSTPTGPNLTK